MKKTLVLIMALALWGICACATSPTATSSTDSPDQGDRELKRGIYWYQKGCIRKAMDHFHAAHEHYCLADRQAGVARSLNSLANVYRHAGDVESAMLFYDAAVSAASRCDDQTVVAQALSNKAAILIESGDLAGAEVLLDEAQLLSRETDSVFAMVLNHRAVLLMKAYRYDEAVTLLDQADSVAVRDGFNACAAIHFTRGRLMMATGKYPEAMTCFQQALSMDRQAGFPRGMADDLSAMADLHERLSEDEAALDCLERSIKIHALVDNREKVMERLDCLQALAEKTGTDIRVTVHFVDQWLSGEAVDAICR
ncbi:MAG: tetratricopeptide repeat protein [Desulfosarcina sp.]|nr:tetratricopeptide repeat protein [Desulfosarcina sp.]MBC2766175.1 tetratricopeptide repeat protein [Desulfosarcina sp.]